MIRFTNGPAAGTTLMLRRAPQFLRVVRGPDGKIDALDQLDDRPALDETITVYRLLEGGGMIHLNMRDKKGKHCGGFYAMATYELVEPQPADADVRSTAAWRGWAESRAKGFTQTPVPVAAAAQAKQGRGERKGP